MPGRAGGRSGDERRPLAIFASRVRFEEKQLLAALDARDVPYQVVDSRRVSFQVPGAGPPAARPGVVPPGAADPGMRWRWSPGHGPAAPPPAGALLREISHNRALYAARLLESAGVPTVNTAAAVAVCGDKLLTTLALCSAGVPVPRCMVALTPEAAMQALDEFGYPAVIKPLTGSWGRLAARVNDPDAARAVLEHRAALPNPQHQITYVQQYIDKPGRDIRGLVAGGEVIGTIYRTAGDWRTNTARDAAALPCPLSDELERLLLAAAAAIGPGIYGIDVMEDTDGALYVNEVNHTPEFHGAAQVLAADIADRYIGHVLGLLDVVAGTRPDDRRPPCDTSRGD